MEGPLEYEVGSEEDVDGLLEVAGEGPGVEMGPRVAFSNDG